MNVDSFDIPILTTIVGIALLAYDAGIVLARVVVTNYHVWHRCRVDEIGEVVVETCVHSLLDAELCRFVCGSLLLAYEYKRTLRLCHCYLGAVAGNKKAILVFPELCLIRTVVLANLDTVTAHTQCLIGNGVDETPTAR